MDIKDVLALANAGFSKDDIAKIAVSLNTPAQAVTPAPAPAQAVTPAQVQTPPQQPAQEPTPVDAILKELGVLKDTMQANAMLGAQQPKPESTDDILASIINPPKLDK